MAEEPGSEPRRGATMVASRFNGWSHMASTNHACRRYATPSSMSRTFGTRNIFISPYQPMNWLDTIVRRLQRRHLPFNSIALYNTQAQ